MSGEVEGQLGSPTRREVWSYQDTASLTPTQIGSKQGTPLSAQSKVEGWMVGRLEIITPTRSNNPFPSFMPEQVFRPGTQWLKESSYPQEEVHFNNTQ